jgi:signal transduction histidine kinase
MSDKQPVRLLVVEDDEDDYFLLQTNLKGADFSKEIQWALSYDQAIEQLHSGTFDIAIIDYRLGAHTGLELVTYIRDHFLFLPTILLTGLKTSSIDDEALRSGVYDYLAKDEYSPESIGRSIRYAIERARVLRSLKESENKFKNLFENANEYVFLANARNEIVDLNKAALQLLAPQSRTQVIGQSLAAYISPLPGTVGGNTSDEVTLKLPGLEEKRTCILTTALADSQQHIYQWVLHDITERIQNEEREKALEKQALTGKFARIIAHEIKNPLTNINLSLLELRHILEELKSKKAGEPSDPEEFISIIERNSKRINTLIEDLLNATRFDTLDMKPLSSGELIDSALVNVSDRLRLKEIRLEKSIEPGVQLKADKEKMTIALLNILVNAVEAMPEKTGILKISAAFTGKHLVIRMTDNGKGIPPDHLSRLFEPFFTSKKGGTGLGLTATYNIITKHDGTIEVSSEVGKGTTFIISLPAQKT